MEVQTCQVRTRQRLNTTRHSQDSGTLNETTGSLQQHLQGAITTYAQIRTTIMEYYRATTAFTKLALQPGSSSVATNYGGGQAPMDIGAINKGKGKHQGKHPKGKGKGKQGTNNRQKTSAFTFSW